MIDVTYVLSINMALLQEEKLQSNYMMSALTGHENMIQICDLCVAAIVHSEVLLESKRESTFRAQLS